MTSEPSLELSTIKALSGSRRTRRIPAGHVIFAAGDCGDVLYGIVSGSVELSWGDDLRESFGPGSCFGVGALVDPEHKRFGTAIATSDVELLEMDRHEFLFAMQELPVFGLEMLHDLEQRLLRIRQRLTS